MYSNAKCHPSIDCRSCDGNRAHGWCANTRCPACGLVFRDACAAAQRLRRKLPPLLPPHPHGALARWI